MHMVALAVKPKKLKRCVEVPRSYVRDMIGKRGLPNPARTNDGSAFALPQTIADALTFEDPAKKFFGVCYEATDNEWAR